jgi:MFS transporter, FHS family, glucose/mannose:H+ symporter
VTVIILLYLAFIFTGVLTALPGPFLPFLLKRWGLTDAQAGSIIAAQFLANMIGALFANRNLRISILVGLATMAVGTFGLTILPWPYLRAAMVCYGLGLGMSIPAINLTVAARQSDGRAASLSMLNGVWGIGAISSPALMFVAQRYASVNALLVGISIILALLFIGVVKTVQPQRQVPANRGSQLQLDMERRPTLKYFAFLFFLYVGAETCIASWINVYAERTQPGAALMLFSPVMCFWAALIIGRAGGAGLLRWVRDEGVYMLSLTLALAAFSLLISGHSMAALILGSVLCGFTMAPVFPLLLSFASESLLAHPGSGWVMACASLGGALLPWATGVISSTYRLRVGLMIPGAAIVALILLGIRMIRHSRIAFLRQRPEPAP